MSRYAICTKCKKAWNISIHTNIKNGYICPKCEGKEKPKVVEKMKRKIGELENESN